MAAAGSDRRIRGFKRWMKHQGIDCSDALLLCAAQTQIPHSISVKAVCDLKEGDVVATIPKQSCLTTKTSSAAHLIEAAQLDGNLGLAVAIMYEKSLGPGSKWFRYLQLLPPFEPIPLLWSLPEIDSLLYGTELHQTVKEDKDLVYQDWKECIEPLLSSCDLNPDFFTVDEYLAAKSLVASRSFQIDEYHGFGMVPLADLFNHKTAAENVHFTAVSSSSESDSDTEGRNGESSESDSDTEGGNGDDGDKNNGDNDPISLDFHSEKEASLETSLPLENEPTYMEMIIVKGVNAGDEVFNTYGYLGNAALLHRYGFTEMDNPFDILNIDLDIVTQWSLSLLSSRSSRRRMSLWRQLGYSGCISENSEYFEISFEGEPQVELLILMYIFLLPENKFHELDLTLSAKEEVKESPSQSSLRDENFLCKAYSEQSKKLLLTQRVGLGLLSLADARENLYGSISLEDEVRLLNECCADENPKRYHSLVLRISERRIVRKLRCFASACGGGKRSRAVGRNGKKLRRQ